MSETSRAMYCFANYQKLWRKLCKRKWKMKFNWKGNWKLTALLPYDCYMASKPRALEVPQSYYDNFFILGIKHRLLTVPLEYLTTTRNDFDVVDANVVTVAQFKERYDFGNRPCIIKNAMTDWPAMKNWQIDQLVERFGDEKFRVDGKQMTMRRYVKYFLNSGDADPMYLFDPKFAKGTQMEEDYDIHPYFEESLFDCLSKKQRPPFRWMVMGPKRSGSKFHLDPHNTSAWNALISGRKRWAFFAPTAPPPPGFGLKGESYAPNAIKWFLHYFYRHPDGNRGGVDQMPGMLEVTQEAGEIIWVPSGWWHLVLNLEDTVAVTQNLCNTPNFSKWCWPSVQQDAGMAFELERKLGPSRPDLFPNHDPVELERLWTKRKEKVKRLKREKKRKKELKKKLQLKLKKEHIKGNQTKQGSEKDKKGDKKGGKKGGGKGGKKSEGKK